MMFTNYNIKKTPANQVFFDSIVPKVASAAIF